MYRHPTIYLTSRPLGFAVVSLGLSLGTGCSSDQPGGGDGGNVGMVVTGAGGSSSGAEATSAAATGPVGSTSGVGGSSTVGSTTTVGTMTGSAASAGGASAATVTGMGGGTTTASTVGGMGGASVGGTTGTGGSGGVGGGSTDPNSPGCGTPISRPDRNEQQTMESGGQTRYYLLDVPENADNQTPLMLIFGLHGFDMNNVAVKDLYNFTERSNGQAITVMPQGEGPPPGDVSHWGDGVLESTWQASETNYDYIQALITDLGERYCIDRSRVFMVGFSMGAFFTNSIACAHNDWFRAFSPIAGGGPTGCDAGVQSAIMVHHGTEDPIVDISSGEDSRDTWIEQNGCSSSGMSAFNGCEAYDGCPDGKPVVWCVGSFDHYIPESVTANIWSFFSGL